MDSRKEHLSEYTTWVGMKRRCYNPKDTSFKVYGGLGIRICEKWRTSFDAFYSDMGSKPLAGYHIHRINYDGDYEPNNCEWVSPSDHARKERRPCHVGSKITERQTEVLDFIIKRKMTPTIREIGSHFDISVKGAYDHVKALEKKGFITTEKNISRSIVVIGIPGEEERR